LPKNYAVTSLGLSCASSADLAGGSARKLSQLSQTGLSSSKFQVDAGPVFSLEAEVARLTAARVTGVGYAVGVELFNSALPKPPPVTSVFKSENTSLSVSAVAASSDGSKLVALLAQDPYTLVTSKDGGATFDAYNSFKTDAIADNDAWAYSLASSADGQVLLAASNPWLNSTLGVDSIQDIYNNGDLWTSRDGGFSWAAADLPEKGLYTEFLSVASSADGMTLSALARSRNGTFVDLLNDNQSTLWDFQETDQGVIKLFTSSNGGTSWSTKPLSVLQNGSRSQLSNDAPRPLQISTDGTRLFVAINDFTDAFTEGSLESFTFRDMSQILASDNLGITWNPIYSTENIYDFATGGANGLTIAVLDDEGIQVSSDGGGSFALVDFGDEESGWNTVEISRNGQYIAAASQNAYYFAVSSDAGESWDQLPVDPSLWTIVGVSDEGGLISFDGDFNLWTQNAPSNGNSVLEAVSRAARMSGAASSSTDVLPAGFFGDAFAWVTGAITDVIKFVSPIVTFTCNQVPGCTEATKAMTKALNDSVGKLCAPKPDLKNPEISIAYAAFNSKLNSLTSQSISSAVALVIPGVDLGGDKTISASAVSGDLSRAVSFTQLEN
jgi:hypothetical protein